MITIAMIEHRKADHRRNHPNPAIRPKTA